MVELQRDKIFVPSGVQGKLKIVLHDVSGTLIRALELLNVVVMIIETYIAHSVWMVTLIYWFILKIRADQVI